MNSERCQQNSFGINLEKLKQYVYENFHGTEVELFKKINDILGWISGRETDEDVFQNIKQNKSSLPTNQPLTPTSIS